MGGNFVSERQNRTLAHDDLKSSQVLLAKNKMVFKKTWNKNLTHEIYLPHSKWYLVCIFAHKRSLGFCMSGCYFTRCSLLWSETESSFSSLTLGLHHKLILETFVRSLYIASTSLLSTIIFWLHWGPSDVNSGSPFEKSSSCNKYLSSAHTCSGTDIRKYE